MSEASTAAHGICKHGVAEGLLLWWNECRSVGALAIDV